MKTFSRGVREGTKMDDDGIELLARVIYAKT
jgi:hypothetical protein